jgi:competence protein ComFB
MVTFIVRIKMEIHNVMEDLVVAEVGSICDSFEKESQGGKDASICTCEQCRQDTICYVLNRTAPHYVVSHRGASRVESIETQQDKADLTALIYEGIRRVSHNQRPYGSHSIDKQDRIKSETPVFSIPTIMGRVFSGLNFSPVADSVVELLQNGELVKMKDCNWQNPYKLIPNTNSAFTFWPAPIPAEKIGTHSAYQYTVKITGDGFEELSHSFTIPVKSEVSSSPFSMDRTFKLPDLYLFPPGEEKAQLNISAD